MPFNDEYHFRLPDEKWKTVSEEAAKEGLMGLKDTVPLAVYEPPSTMPCPWKAAKPLPNLWRTSATNTKPEKPEGSEDYADTFTKSFSDFTFPL